MNKKKRKRVKKKENRKGKAIKGETICEVSKKKRSCCVCEQKKKYKHVNKRIHYKR